MGAWKTRIDQLLCIRHPVMIKINWVRGLYLMSLIIRNRYLEPGHVSIALEGKSHEIIFTVVIR
jgi:hypothetical protein